MDTTRLIDWSPVLHIMLSGMLLALGPLSWVGCVTARCRYPNDCSD